MKKEVKKQVKNIQKQIDMDDFRRHTCISYGELDKSELIRACEDKDAIIEALTSAQSDVLNKDDIKAIYKCEDGKALKMLRSMFQMGYGNKIGKEYYISRRSHNDFLKCFAGKEVYI